MSIYNKTHTIPRFSIKDHVYYYHKNSIRSEYVNLVNKTSTFRMILPEANSSKAYSDIRK